MTANESDTTFDALFGVAAVPHDEDVWAVGDAIVSQNNLIEAWDGSAWNIVPNPNP